MSSLGFILIYGKLLVQRGEGPFKCFFKRGTKSQIYLFKDHFSSSMKDSLGRVLGKPAGGLYGIILKKHVSHMELR